MPLYEFRCSECGPFDQWRTMAECSNPAYCPSCQQVGRRIFSAPAVLSSSLPLKRGSEPELVKRESEPKTQQLRNAGGRPWMISH